MRSIAFFTSTSSDKSLQMISLPKDRLRGPVARARTEQLAHTFGQARRCRLGIRRPCGDSSEWRFSLPIRDERVEDKHGQGVHGLLKRGFDQHRLR